eukprot:2983595-Prymnesium_polylepis.1
MGAVLGDAESARQPFDATVCFLNGVPPEERFFLQRTKAFTDAATREADAARRRTKITPLAQLESDAALDFDVMVAVHDIGAGAVAYFGDVNCGWDARELLAGLLSRRAPPLPPASIAPQLDDAGYATVLADKAEGNAAFASGRHAAAIDAYDRAMSRYDGRPGGAGAQREEKLRLLSNRAECCLKLGRWSEAVESATAALRLDGAHAKSLLRRAKARLLLEADGKARRKALERAAADAKA